MSRLPLEEVRLDGIAERGLALDASMLNNMDPAARASLARTLQWMAALLESADGPEENHNLYESYSPASIGYEPFSPTSVGLPERSESPALELEPEPEEKQAAQLATGAAEAAASAAAAQQELLRAGGRMRALRKRAAAATDEAAALEERVRAAR